MTNESVKPKTAIVVGAGHRAVLYTEYACNNPEKLKIIGVAEPNPTRRKNVAEMHNISENMQFGSAEELAKQPKLADAIINGTMDRDHISTTIPFLKLGYDVLLEKPIGIAKQEVLDLLDVAKEENSKVMICHVLRYAPFYQKIRQLIADQAIGDKILSIQTSEHVSYHHYSAAFVRGKWSREDVCGSTMLMAKCCHDLDIVMWMKTGVFPKTVCSFGEIAEFTPKNAPEGSGDRCLVDCSVEPDCVYSAKKLYLDHPGRWDWYVWDNMEHIDSPTLEDKKQSLMTNNPHGRCMWKSGQTVVDNQSVLIQFADDSTATHNLVCGTSRPARYIHIVGNKGEIRGSMEDGKFVLLQPDTRAGKEYSEELIDVNVSGDMHGGGDLRLVEDFVRILNNEEPSISSTFLDDSIYGHLVGFAADESRVKKQMVNIKQL